MEIKSDMVANVWKVLVGEGEIVEDGEVIVILESMKMEIPIEAEEAGTITKLNVAEGDSIQEGHTIAIIE